MAAVGLLAAAAGCGSGSKKAKKWPFNADEARFQQVAAARAAGVPEELSLDLGGGVTMDFVLIPAGEFMMGSLDEQSAFLRTARPLHRVEITRPFYMAATETTQAQWRALMSKDYSEFKGPTLPVDSVGWVEARDFCRRLGERTGRDARLPTEAEWEYACRAGTDTVWYCGDSKDSLAEYAWFNSDLRTDDRTHPVAQKRPNAFGLYDIHGNVWEWCSDYHDRKYYESPDSAIDPQGPRFGRHHVRRGGSARNWAKLCRSALRSALAGGARGNFTGLRVVLTVE